MKKILFSLLLIVGAALGTYAQTINYGIKGGLNLSNNVTNFSKYYPSFYGGGFAEIKLSKRWSIQPELLYYTSGENHRNPFATPKMEEKIRQNYLNVPLMIKFYITPKLYVETGPEVNFLLNAKQEINGHTENTNEYYRRVSLSTSAGIGYKLPYGLGVSARYGFGVTNISIPGSLFKSNGQVGINYSFKR